MTGMHQVEHIFSVDVEEHFQVNAFENAVPRESWHRYPSRVGASVDRVLAQLERHGATGTFFVLGWVAHHHPEVVKRIAAAGHEVASHGWWHRRVWQLTPEQFRADVESSKDILEQVCGQEVVGFRAPSFSIVHGGEWAFDVLLDAGYRYDSSLFPIRRPGYGYPSAPTHPHLIKRAGGVLVELPIATRRMWGLRVPAGGGGYFRQLPYGLCSGALAQSAAQDTPGVFFIHPWEVDPAQPRLDVPWLTRIRHYRGLSRTAPRLERLLGEYSFTSVARSSALRGIFEAASPRKRAIPA